VLQSFYVIIKQLFIFWRFYRTPKPSYVTLPTQELRIQEKNTGNVLLKGQCHEILEPGFFHQTIPPRSLIHGRKQFRIRLRVRRENRDSRLKNSDSAVSMTPRYLTWTFL
jgi:hypothetical protein